MRLDRLMGVVAPCALLWTAIGTAAAAPPSNKALQLSKVLLNTEAAIKGKTKVGTICLFGGGKLNFTQNQKTLDLEHYENLFAKHMRDSGYIVVANSADLFADADGGKKGDVLFGATLRPDTINLCSSVNGEKGDIIILVDWKVFDQASKKVVFAVSTTGAGRQEKFAADGLIRMLDQAFVSSLDALLREDAMQKLVGAPRPSPEKSAAPAAGGTAPSKTP